MILYKIIKVLKRSIITRLRNSGCVMSSKKISAALEYIIYMYRSKELKINPL